MVGTINKLGTQDPTLIQQPPTEILDLWDRPDPFVVPISVGPEHIDELVHASNVHYLEWLQVCAWQHSTAVGLPPDKMIATGCGMAVREVRMSYLLATVAGDQLWVANWIVHCDGRVRATRAFQILRVSDLACVMRAEIDYICINVASGRPRRMPAEFITAYSVSPLTVGDKPTRLP